MQTNESSGGMLLNELPCLSGGSGSSGFGLSASAALSEMGLLSGCSPHSSVSNTISCWPS